MYMHIYVSIHTPTYVYICVHIHAIMPTYSLLCRFDGVHISTTG